MSKMSKRRHVTMTMSMQGILSDL